MKTAVCISCTNHYQERIRDVEVFLREQGYRCIYITSDYDHWKKQRYTLTREDCIQIPTRAYRRNISWQRIASHFSFARKAMAEVERIAPELLYVEVPPNSLCWRAARYRKRHPRVRLVLDVFDLWPESFPDRGAKALLKLPFALWARLRNRHLQAADRVYTECRLFLNLLKPHLGQSPAEVLYLCRPEATLSGPCRLPEGDSLGLCYLGSINHLIDIPAILSLLRQLGAQRSVALHVIGAGERCGEFLEAARQTGVQVLYHGAIYDPVQRQAVFDRCHFGINIMKDSVCVGITMKSVDYFAAGLPILNNIAGDSRQLVEEHHVGIQVGPRAAEQILALTPEELLQMRREALGVFTAYFSKTVFLDKMRRMISEQEV